MVYELERVDIASERRFPNNLRKNNDSFHSALNYSPKFQFCGGEWRIGSQKSGDLEKKG